MILLRSTIPILALLAALFLPLGARATTGIPSAGRPFGGVVQDALGTTLARVEVFLVPETGAVAGPVRATTDELGRFLLRDVVPGIYRVAAVKQGYAVYLDRVNTGLRSTLEVVLHPLPLVGEPGAESVTDDPSWALRVPRRSVWNDVAAVPVVAPGGEAEASRAAIPADVVEGSVEQRFAIAAPSAGGWDGGLQGNETGVALASRLSESVRLALDGRRSRFESGARGDAAGPAWSAADTTAVGLGLRAQPTGDVDLDVRAFWAARETSLSSPLAAPADAFRQAERVWGYDAGWRQRLDARSTLDVRMDYAASTLELPGGSVAGAAVAGDSVHVGARGAYETVPDDRHRVRVAFGARFAEAGLPTLGDVEDGVPMVRVDDGGWSLGIAAEDTWTVRGPLAVVYGLGYRHRIGDDESAVLVPAVGGEWSDGERSLRMVVRYHAETVWSGATLEDGTRPERASRSEIGYEASAATSLPLGFVLEGGLSYEPIGVGFVGRGPRPDPVAGSRPVYLAEGDAEVREASATLRHAAGPASVFVQWTRGRVEGSLTPGVPFDVPYAALEEATLRFRTGRIGVDVPASGTRVLVEHRRIRDRAAGTTTASDLRSQDQVELRLVQDLLRYPGSSWRLLLSLQAAELDGAALAHAEHLAGQPLPDSHRRVDAGVAVAF